MASAVLASRNEPQWGEGKVYMRNYTKTPISIANSSNFPHFNPNPNPRLNPNPNFNHGKQHIHEHAGKPHFRPNDEPSPRVAVPSGAEFHRKPISGNAHKDAFHKEYVTFDLALYSKIELKQLKKRLVSELDRVRKLRNQIEAREIESRPGFQPPRGHAFDSVVAQPEAFKKSKVERHHLGSDFASGKSRNQRKNKKLLGQKRRNANVVSSGRDSKRPAVVAAALEVSPVDKVVAAMMKKCKQILTKLMKQKGAAWWFNAPVDVEGMNLFDYYQIIKHPMDLGTVKLKLEKNCYDTPLAFAADVRLTFNNAMTYNLKGLEVHSMAEKLLSMFDRMFDPAFKKFEAGYRSVVANVVDVEQMNVNHQCFDKPEPKPMHRALPEPLLVKNNADQMNMPPTLLNLSGGEPAEVAPLPIIEPRSGKLPKPKARDLNKRPMSYEEKANLGANLQELPPEKAEQMLHIVKKRIPHLMQQGDEIELDIESLDNETLRELERFVAYHKKAVSKMKRQELIQNAGSAAQVNKSPFHEVVPDVGLQKNKKGDMGEEDVDIGEEIPVGNFPPVEIEKDAAGASSGSSSSSSSGSSSDSSSSSDSGSGSSSGSDSEEDSVQSPFVESKDAHGA